MSFRSAFGSTAVDLREGDAARQTDSSPAHVPFARVIISLSASSLGGFELHTDSSGSTGVYERSLRDRIGEVMGCLLAHPSSSPNGLRLLKIFSRSRCPSSTPTSQP